MDLYANDRSWSVKVGTGGDLPIADGSWDAVILAPSRPAKERLETSGIAWQPKPTRALYSKWMALNCLVLDARERNRFHRGGKAERFGNRFCW